MYFRELLNFFWLRFPPLFWCIFCWKISRQRIKKKPPQNYPLVPPILNLPSRWTQIFFTSPHLLVSKSAQEKAKRGFFKSLFHGVVVNLENENGVLFSTRFWACTKDASIKEKYFPRNHPSALLLCFSHDFCHLLAVRHRLWQLLKTRHRPGGKGGGEGEGLGTSLGSLKTGQQVSFLGCITSRWSQKIGSPVSFGGVGGGTAVDFPDNDFASKVNCWFFVFF